MIDDGNAVISGGTTAGVRRENGGPFVDLHMHSTASDGALPPEEVVAAASKVGLAAIALTDHDSVAGIPAAAAAAATKGIDLVVGVELSATQDGREIHILGLHLDRLDALEVELREFREARMRRAISIVEKLRALGVAITMEAVLRRAGGSAIGRPHIARTLVESGAVADVRTAFDQYLGAGRAAYVAKEVLTPAEAISIIHAAGGLAIVAHPGGEGTLAYLTQLRQSGLDGAEVLHPSHSTEDIARLAAITAELKMIRSGGSDWHGVDAGKRKLGNQDVPFGWLSAQRERVEEMRARDRG